jgi:hypothetical protein
MRSSSCECVTVSTVGLRVDALCLWKLDYAFSYPHLGLQPPKRVELQHLRT